MKIAVQLFGHLRTFRECHSYLAKHLLDLYECDVFVHTWSFEDHVDPTWHKESNVLAANITDEKELLRLYKPKGL